VEKSGSVVNYFAPLFLKVEKSGKSVVNYFAPLFLKVEKVDFLKVDIYKRNGIEN